MIFRRSHGGSEIIKIKNLESHDCICIEGTCINLKKNFYSSIWTQMLSFSKWHPLTNWLVCVLNIDIFMRINCSTKLMLSSPIFIRDDCIIFNGFFFSYLHVQSLCKSSIILQNVLTPPPTKKPKTNLSHYLYP